MGTTLANDSRPMYLNRRPNRLGPLNASVTQMFKHAANSKKDLQHLSDLKTYLLDPFATLKF